MKYINAGYVVTFVTLFLYTSSLWWRSHRGRD